MHRRTLPSLPATLGATFRPSGSTSGLPDNARRVACPPSPDTRPPGAPAPIVLTPADRIEVRRIRKALSDAGRHRQVTTASIVTAALRAFLATPEAVEGTAYRSRIEAPVAASGRLPEGITDGSTSGQDCAPRSRVIAAPHTRREAPTLVRISAYHVALLVRIAEGLGRPAPTTQRDRQEVVATALERALARLADDPAGTIGQPLRETASGRQDRPVTLISAVPLNTRQLGMVSKIVAAARRSGYRLGRLEALGLALRIAALP